MTTVVAYNTTPCPHCGCPDTKPFFDNGSMRPMQHCPQCQETSKVQPFMARPTLVCAGDCHVSLVMEHA